MTSDEAEKAQWRYARDWFALCELMAQFVEGKRTWRPGYQEREISPQTRKIADPLAAINRRGLLTLAAQPGGRRRKPPTVRRAYVAGLALPAIAAGLVDQLTPTDLYVAAYDYREPEYRPKRRTQIAAAVTLKAGRAVKHVGLDRLDTEPPLWFALVESPPAELLRQASYVVVVDMQWGRRVKLFEQVAAAVAATLRVVSPEGEAHGE